MAKKERLDKVLVARGLVPTRAKGQGLIMAGEVLVDGVREMIEKAGMEVKGKLDGWANPTSLEITTVEKPITEVGERDSSRYGQGYDGQSQDVARETTWLFHGIWL